MQARINSSVHAGAAQGWQGSSRELLNLRLPACLSADKPDKSHAWPGLACGYHRAHRWAPPLCGCPALQAGDQGGAVPLRHR